MTTDSRTPDLKSLRKRGYHVFLSHAHVDRESVDRLRNWLDQAELDVWYDAEKAPAGNLIPTMRPPDRRRMVDQ